MGALPTTRLTPTPGISPKRNLQSRNNEKESQRGWWAVKVPAFGMRTEEDVLRLYDACNYERRRCGNGKPRERNAVIDVSIVTLALR